MEYNLVVPCLFGMEAVLKKEIINLGYEIVSVQDGRVTYKADELGICRSNIWLRTGERVLIQVAEFEARTFEELFQGIKEIRWEDYIVENGKFWVTKASSIKSKLFSPRDIQSIVKKAIVERLKVKYSTNWFKEDGPEYPIRIFIHKDKVSVGIDSSYEALHKRGYRLTSGIAPIRESLAAGLIMLSNWNKDKTFVDPFCGSGTLPIEAAMIGANIAPGINRESASENWKNIIDKKLWMQAVDEAYDLEDSSVKLNIQGFDKDFRMLKIARENAENASVDQHIHFQEREMSKLSSSQKYGVIVTNPPYGERMEEKEDVMKLYQEMGRVFMNMDTWSYYIITSFDEFERHFGKKADKNRKIYSGMLKTYFYQYITQPPRRKKIVVE